MLRQEGPLDRSGVGAGVQGVKAHSQKFWSVKNVGKEASTFLTKQWNYTSLLLSV